MFKILISFVLVFYSSTNNLFALDEPKIDFPLEIWQEIFSYISDIKTIESFALVSKTNSVLIFLLPKEMWLRREKALNKKLEFLSKCPHLIGLTIDNSSTIKVDLEIFNKFSKLNFVALLSCIFFSDEPLNFLSSLTTIKKLNLAASNITDKDLKSLSCLTNLKKLNLSSIVVITGLKDLTCFINLKSLNLFNTLIEDRHLLHLAKLTKLEELNLNYCGFIHGEGFRHLTILTNLKRLYLKKLKVRKRFLKHLSCLTDLKILR